MKTSFVLGASEEIEYVVTTNIEIIYVNVILILCESHIYI